MNSFSRKLKRNGARQTQHRGGPRDQHQHQCHGERRQQPLRQPVGPGQQAEQHEHGDLREPGRGIEERHDGVVGAGLAIADDQPGDIDREEAGAVQRLGQPERHQRAGGDERRMHALRQHQAVEHEHHGAAAEPAEEAADDRLLGQQMRRCRSRTCWPENRISTRTMVRKIANGSLMPDSTSSVARTRGPQPQALGVEQEEHRRGVGRGHHGADQQRLAPVQLQRPDRDRRGQRRGDQDADGGQQARRAPARCGTSRAACASRRRTGSGRAPPSRPYRPAARRRT